MILTVPRAFGGTLIITYTPAAVASSPPATVNATGRDGRVAAIGRDGRVTATGRDGFVIARGR